MSDVAQIYYWEDDDEAAELLEQMKAAGVPFEAETLDPEMGEARFSVTYRGETYWDVKSFRRVIS